MIKDLIALVLFVALAPVWFTLVSAIGVRWTVGYAKAPSGSDTFFILRSWTFRSLLIVPPMLFAFWLGRVW